MSALGRALARRMRRIRPEPPGPFETPRRRRDPSPSRWRYRLDRLGRRGYVRFAVRRLTVPVLIALAALWAWRSPTVQDLAMDLALKARAVVVERPEFAVLRLDIQGGSPDLQSRVAARLDLPLPVSSLELDLAELKAEVETIPGVARAEPKVMADGALRIEIAQRAPAALWRWDGQLHLLDRDGVVIGPVASRADRPNLPLILGEGADRAIDEGLRLWDLAQPVNDRLRGLVRVGERRWSLALSSGMVVHLPEKEPEGALRRLLRLDRDDQLLDREVSIIDLRDPERPTLRLTPRAVDVLEGARELLEGQKA
ncbi:cell division protein FtsQ/DivIB [Albimonas sp. CAU 1670]|uniref:cell division protein FtsQ/DivIB n=1 Tax=Albimonas sp. CAU 1670 TaxID=3032599 RepID=UPI0023DAFAE6|nr:cell division protein FtsQ/DivIB [Albimonas sp. CAU 1670]MDF2233994.1 cell division protein FtsQ/DivIB [Albimonas sp. CAU 1670]